MTPRERMRSFVDSWLKPVLPMLLVLLTVRSAIADWNDVPTGSMRPTILEGDRIFVNKLAFGLRVPFTLEWIAVWDQPARGDVIVFHSPEDSTRMVKRVIGLPGDRVEMRDNVLSIDGEVVTYRHVDGTTDSMATDHWPVRETLGRIEHLIQLTPQISARRTFGPVRVPAGSYLVMGDNRDSSFDSRYFGFVPADRIVGRTGATAMSFDPEHYYRPRWERFLTPLD